jgi:hypothetical protein
VVTSGISDDRRGWRHHFAEIECNEARFSRHQDRRRPVALQRAAREFNPLVTLPVLAAADREQCG